MKKTIIFLFLIFSFYNLKSQKINGTYKYYMGPYGDIARFEWLTLQLHNDNTFELYITSEMNDYDTAWLSYGKYKILNDTLSYLSIYKDLDSVFFYPSNKKLDSTLIVSFYHSGYPYVLADKLGDYSFFAINNELNKVEIIPFDTIPDYGTAKHLIDYNLDLYFSYYLKIPSNYKYIMINTLRRNLWSERFSDNYSLTFELSKLKTKNIAIRKDKIRLHGEFMNINFLDVTTYKFILKNDSIISIKPIFPEGTIIFKKDS